MRGSRGLFKPAFTPDFSLENRLHRDGMAIVCGVDEAGRGPLAGPVVAAAVILDPNYLPAHLDDSKRMTEAQREHAFSALLSDAQVGIAVVPASTIDELNIRAASLLAMVDAVNALKTSADAALIDGNAIPHGLPCPGHCIIKGDQRSLSIAAASIVAKVVRDRMMVHADAQHPDYGFAGHKGYPTAAHRAVLAEKGPCPIHRRSFAPVKAAMLRMAE